MSLNADLPGHRSADRADAPVFGELVWCRVKIAVDSVGAQTDLGADTATSHVQKGHRGRLLVAGKIGFDEVVANRDW
jgi:hypothetical protein